MSLKVDKVQLEIIMKSDTTRMEMRKLDDEAKAIQKSMRGMKKDSDEYVQASNKLKEVKAKYDQLSNSISLNSKTMNELNRRANELRAMMNNVTPGTADWIKYKNELNLVNNRMKELRGTAQKTQSFFSTSANFLNKYFLGITSVIAGITGLSMTFRKLAEDVAHMDDVFSDVMKTTGLTHKQVEALNDELKKMDTRTSREDLNKLASEAGKLGIEGSKNILDFVDAGNQIKVALGEDLGEDAIKNIGKMVGVFDKSTKQLQGMGLKEQMLAVGSAVNELGASSSASEDYLVQFAGRLGGVASQAGLSVDAILGFGSALDQDMQQVEMSATALQNFIMKLMGEPAKFAKIAGMNVKEFSNLLNTDANTAIKQVLRAMNEKGGFQQLIPIFNEMGLDGARAVGVLSAMASSIDKIDEAQKIANKALVEGTSITKEYNTKNNNLQAQLEKARKSFKETSLELGSKLNPILLTSTKYTTYLIKGISALAEHPKIILQLVAAFTAYLLVMNKTFIAEKISQVLHAAKILGLKIRIALTNQATEAELRLVGAQNSLNAAMKKNLWGLLAAAITFALLKLTDYIKKQTELTEGEKIYKNLKQEQIDLIKQNSEAISQEKTELSTLVMAIMNTNDNEELRNRLIDQLNEKFPGFISFIDKEKVTNELLAAALANVNEQYDLKLKNTALSSKSQAYENAAVKAMERQIEIEEELKTLRADVTKDNSKRINELENEDKQLTKNIENYKKQATGYRAEMQQNAILAEKMNTPEYYKAEMQEWANTITEIQRKAKEAQERGNYDQLNYYNEQIKQASASYVYARTKYNELLKGNNLQKENNNSNNNGLSTPLPTPTPSEKNPAASEKKRYQEEMSKLDQQYAEVALATLKAYRTGEIATEKEFNETNKQNQIDYLNEKLLTQKNFSEQAKYIQEEVNKDIISTETDLENIRIGKQKEADKEMLELLKISYETKNKATDAWETAEKEKLQDKADAGIITETEYRRDLLAIELAANQQRLSSAQQYEEDIKATSFKSKEEQEKAEKDAAENVKKAQEDVLKTQKQVDIEKLKEQREFEEKRKSLLEKYGLESEKDIYKKELEELKKSLNEKLITEEEYQIAKRVLTAKYAGEQIGKAQEVINEVSDSVSAYHQMEIDSLEAEKQKELSANEDKYKKHLISQEQYEAQKKDISDKYAQKELDLKKKQANSDMVIKIAQAVAAGAQAIASVWAVHAANPILAAILSAAAAATVALQVVSIKKQRDAIMATTLESSTSGSETSRTGSRIPNSQLGTTTQQAEGKWDVIGEQDRRLYRGVPYKGKARTGIYRSPVLVAERGDELVIDHPTLSNLKLHAPNVLNTINRMRVRQYAEGNYDILSGNGKPDMPTPSGNGLSETLVKELILLLKDNQALLDWLKTNKIEAGVMLSEFEKKRQLRDKSIKKGSL